jgi:hypothetical protein
MATSTIVALGRFDPIPRKRDPAVLVLTLRERTNGAPCLGFALMAGSLAWAGLGSALVLLLA